MEPAERHVQQSKAMQQQQSLEEVEEMPEEAMEPADALTCGKCGHRFTKASGLTKHRDRPTPCLTEAERLQKKLL